MMEDNVEFEVKEGAEVEVSPDDEGFAGSWYAATVLQLPPPTNYKTNNNNKAATSTSTEDRDSDDYVMVEYKTLLDDDEVSPLKERVKLHHIRPPFPSTSKDDCSFFFQLNDTVEAFHNEGWWVGVITTTRTSDRFVVSFSNPPDEAEFAISDLRPHLDWLNSKWVQPQTQTHHKNKRRGRPSKLHTKSSNSLTGGTLEGQERDLTRDQVTTNHQKDHLDHLSSQNIEETNQSKSRQKSLRKKRVNPAKVLAENVLANKRLRSEMKTPLSSRHKLEASNDKILTHSWGKRARQSASYSAVDDGSNLEKRDEISKMADNMAKEAGLAVSNHHSPGSSVSDNQPLSLWLPSECPAPSVDNSSTVIGKIVKDLTDSITSKQAEIVSQVVDATIAVEGNVYKDINNNQVLKILDPAVAAALKRDGSRRVTDPNKELDTLQKSVPAAAAIVEGSLINSNHQNMAVIKKATAVDGGNIIDQNFEMDQVSAVEGNANASSIYQNLPFVKASPLWKYFEPMEIFQAIPQKPHFRTLYTSCPVSWREGQAIGYMVTFSNVAAKTTQLQLSDSKTFIEECMETLADLRNDGFDVEVIEDRLTTLLSKKDDYDLLQNQLRNHETLIAKHKCEKTKVDEEIDKLDKQIMELQEKRASVLSLREKKEHEIECVESKLKSICLDMEKFPLDFEQVATAPW